MTKLERFAQLDGLLAEQDGMLQTSQAVARGIVKPIFYEYIKERKLEQVAHGMPDKLYDYADYIKLRLVINLYCSRQRTIMYAVEVQNGLYDTKRGRRKMGRDTS